MEQYPSALQAFLADAEANCPRCRYSLRGLNGDTCPECGLALRLEISGPGHGRALWLIVLALLGWVTLASGMGAYRAYRDVASESVVGQTFVVQSGGKVQRINVTPGQPLILNGGVSLGQGTGTIAAQRWTITASPQGGRAPVLGGVPVVGRLFATPAPVRNWSAVRWQTWVRLGGWGALGLGGAAVLVTGVLVLRRAGSPGRLPVACACVAFGLYACGHLAAFVRDVAG